MKTIAPVGNIPAGVYDLNAELEHGFFLGTRMTRMTRIFLGTRMTRMTRIFFGNADDADDADFFGNADDADFFWERG